MITPNLLPLKSATLRRLTIVVTTVLISGCINPLGPIGKGPQPRPEKPPPQLSQKFAWGISTASYQYEDPAVGPGDKDFFYSDWDILIEQRKAPPKGNALYSWTRFDKDLEALKKIGVTHYRFSISWPRVEPQPGVYNEQAITRLRRNGAPSQGRRHRARDLPLALHLPVLALR